MRTTGAANEVVQLIAGDQELFDRVFEGIKDNDPGLRMRCADALEKASAKQPELLKSHQGDLLNEVAAIDQQEVQWHVAQMLPRLELAPAELEQAVKVLERYYETTKSSIVRANALQGIVELAGRYPALDSLANQYIQKALNDQAPAVQARARHMKSSA